MNDRNAEQGGVVRSLTVTWVLAGSCPAQAERVDTVVDRVERQNTEARAPEGIVEDDDPTRWILGDDALLQRRIPAAAAGSHLPAKRSGWLARNGLALAVALVLTLSFAVAASWVGASEQRSEGLRIRWGSDVYHCTYDPRTAIGCGEESSGH